ncbi:MAG TPA: tetratricopeptide repeat protein [Rhodocyclaceae bacterium]|jgi:predicted negative regulator of RcsB-dependent stress response|nr:tetratricopeptide repeat protein [Rhodocyclaceae bacterium]
MAVYDHEEQEQLESLKAWWRDHGNKVISAVLVLALIAAAVFGWQWWQVKQAGDASVIYGQLQAAAEKKDTKVVQDAAVALVDKYSGTAFAGMGALVAARVEQDAGDSKNAQAQLAWAADKASDPALRDLARLRLAGLLLDQKSYDDALKQLAKAPEKNFAPRYAELKGDVLLAQGKQDEARAAYQDALNQLDGQGADAGSASQQNAVYHQMLQIKLESLGGKA